MSTKFAARKFMAQTVETEQVDKVNWLYHADLGTMAFSISDRSGLVKLDLGLGRRNPALYANEIRAILDNREAIERYLDDHPQAVNTPPSKKEQAAQAALTSQVTAAIKADQVRKMVLALKESGLDDVTIAKTIATMNQK